MNQQINQQNATQPIILDASQTAKDDVSNTRIQNCTITVVFTILYMSLSFGIILMLVFIVDLQINVWATFGVGLTAALILMCAVIHIMFALQKSNNGGCECA
jgi:hypothetical protein